MPHAHSSGENFTHAASHPPNLLPLPLRAVQDECDWHLGERRVGSSSQLHQLYHAQDRVSFLPVAGVKTRGVPAAAAVGWWLHAHEGWPLSFSLHPSSPNHWMDACPACRAPVIVSAQPTSPTTAAILLNPPAAGGPVTSYEVKLCPSAPATGPCITKSCPTASCSVTGLTPGATYIVSAAAVVGGVRVPASNTLPLTMPAADRPTLISAVDTSATTANTTAAPPRGATYTQVGLRVWRF